MTGSWDKTLKVCSPASACRNARSLFSNLSYMTHSCRFPFQFWDTRSPNPMMSLQMPERCYCADVVCGHAYIFSPNRCCVGFSVRYLNMCDAAVQVYPMAVVATAERGLIVYQLENQPSEFRRLESPLKHQASTCFFFLCRETRVRSPGSFSVTPKCNLATASCSTAVWPFSRTSRTSPLALRWEASRDASPSTISTLPTRKRHNSTQLPLTCFRCRWNAVECASRSLDANVFARCQSEPKTTSPSSATGPMEPTRPPRRTSTL